MTNKKALLIILDGWGLSPLTEGNATYLAKTPTLDAVYGNYPKISLSASGLEVGLNPGEMGNSEVGHLNIGSGRVVWETLPRIDQSIKRGDFFELPTLRQTADYLKKTGGRLQLIGLCSSGGVHSHINHLFSLIDFAVGENIKSFYLHLFTDGRDTAPKEALTFVDQVEKKLKSARAGKIASVIGRFFSMDRDNNWDRTKIAYDLIVNGVANKLPDARSAIESSYQKGKADEYLEAAIIDNQGCVKPGDAIIFFNFRADRARQILQAFEDPTKVGRDSLGDLFIASMSKYFEDERSKIVFEPNDLKNVLADVLEANNLRQYHTAETEKYAHVTYFFNGGRHQIHRFEKQIVVPSPKVKSYALKPEMSVVGVADKTIEGIKSEHNFIVVNFANGDMVGHTGKLSAAIEACQAVDQQLNRVLVSASAEGYDVLITADHGNCEIMIDPISGEEFTEHTTSPVPLCYLAFNKKPFSSGLTATFSKEDLVTYGNQAPVSVLADISPTILEILELSKPKEMFGASLLSTLN